MFINDLIDCLLGNDVFLVVCLYENISNIRILNLSLGDLNFGAAFVLQSADSLAIFSNN